MMPKIGSFVDAQNRAPEEAETRLRRRHSARAPIEALTSAAHLSDNAEN
jgi:hypothetical protein